MFASLLWVFDPGHLSPLLEYSYASAGVTVNPPGHSPASGPLTVNGIDCSLIVKCHCSWESCPKISSVLTLHTESFPKELYPLLRQVFLSVGSSPFLEHTPFYSMLLYALYLDRSYLSPRLQMRYCFIWKVFADTPRYACIFCEPLTLCPFPSSSPLNAVLWLPICFTVCPIKL